MNCLVLQLCCITKNATRKVYQAPKAKRESLNKLTTFCDADI